MSAPTCPNCGSGVELNHVATGDLNETKPRFRNVHPERRPTLIADVWRCRDCGEAWHTIEDEETLHQGNPFDL